MGISYSVEHGNFDELIKWRSCFTFPDELIKWRSHLETAKLFHVPRRVVISPKFSITYPIARAERTEREARVTNLSLLPERSEESAIY